MGQIEENLTLHKVNSGPKNSKEELLFGGGFQKGTKKEAQLGKNLQLKEFRTSNDSKDTIHNNQESEYYDSDSDSNSDSDTEYDTDSEESDSSPESDETSEFQDDGDILDNEYYGEDYGEYHAPEPYRECVICLTPFIQYGEMYCNGGCPIEALNKLDSVEPDYKKSINKEISNIQPIASG